MTKKFQAIVQLCSFHLLARLCSKSFKIGFNSMSKLRTSRGTSWISKTQRKQRSNWQHLVDRGESKGVPENIYFCFIDYTKIFNCVDHDKLWKILKEIGISEHLTCLMRNLYAGQEATVRTGHGTTNWFQIRKGVSQGCILSPCLLNYMQNN